MCSSDSRLGLPTNSYVVAIFWFVTAWCILVPWQLYCVSCHPWFDRPPLPIGDGPDYEAIGFSLSQGLGFTFPWDQAAWKAPYLTQDVDAKYVQLDRDSMAGPTSSRPPLFPLVIAAVYSFFPRGAFAFAVIRLLSAICIATSGAIAAGIAYSITERILFEKKHSSQSTDPKFDQGTVIRKMTPHLAAFIAVCLALMDRTIRTYAVDFLSEPLALLLTSLCILVAIAPRWNASVHGDSEVLFETGISLRRACLLGLLFGLMILTRSLFVFWFPGMMLLFLLNRAKWSSVLMFLIVASFTAAPWWVRNCVVHHQFMPLGSQGAVTLLGGYCEAAYRDGGNWQPEPERALRSELASQTEWNHLSSLDREALLASVAGETLKDWVFNHFDWLPALAWERLKTHWGPYWGSSLVWRLGILSGVAVLIFNRRQESYWLIGTLVVSSLVVMCVYETGGRFLVPLYTVLYALAGIGVAWPLQTIADLIFRKDSRRDRGTDIA